MKKITMTLICLSFVVALVTSCASTGTGHKTARLLQMDQGSRVQSMEITTESMIY